MMLTKQPFGVTEKGEKVDLYTLKNKNSMEVSITNYGGIITKIIVQDKDGNFGDVTLGYDSVEGYIKATPYFGAIIGRYGNRIAKGEFEINGIKYELAKNDGEHHLHGGKKGFDKVLWTADPIYDIENPKLELSYLSKDGEEGYPGNLSIKVTYTLTLNNEIKIDYEAATDKETVCNLTNHAYFNLKDGGKSEILDHKIMINANGFTPIVQGLIPTGDLRDVDNTPFDFREFRQIGSKINDSDAQIELAAGYDHNFVINGNMGELRIAARVIEESTGRILEVYTEEPGIQFYSGNFLDGSIIGKNKIKYNRRSGFCLESQHFPNSPNIEEFPTSLLKPSEFYRTSTIYKFLTVHE